MTATQLSAKGRAARAKVSYRWYVGRTATKATGRAYRVPTTAYGRLVRVRVAVTKPGRTARAKVISFGAATGIPQNANDLAAARAQILADTNAARAAEGKAPLAAMRTLDTVAQNWTQRMALSGTLAHNPSYWKQYPAGWSSAGENVAMGYVPRNVVSGWMGSEGHRANILGDFTHLGIGVVRTGNGTYWFTQNFAKY
ncbi:hypothetical protein GCM10025786_33090 [Nocardioides caeni]